MSYTPEIQNINSAENSTTLTSITGGEIFQGTGVDVTQYGTASISVWTPFGESTAGTLTVEISRDGVNYGGPTRRCEASDTSQPHMWTIAEQYFRIKYEVDTAQTASSLVIQTQFSVNRPIQLAHQLDEIPINEHEAVLVKAVLTGEKPGANSIYDFVHISHDSKLEVNNPTTAFGELRVANSTPIVQAMFPYSTINSRIWNSTLSGSSIISAESSVVSVSAGSSASSATLESRKRLHYRPGQGALVRFTGIFSTPKHGSTQEIGIGDSTDGLFFCTSGDQYGVNRRRGGTDNITLQSDWNVDAASGLNVLPLINFELGNVFEIQYQWLGFGAMTFKLEDPTTGDYIPVHRISFANENTLPSLFNPTLPLRIYTANTTNTTPIVLKSSSMAAFIEGEIVNTGPRNSAQNTVAAAGATKVFGIAIQNKSTYSSIDNRVPIELDNLFIVNENNRAAVVDIYRNIDLTSYTLRDVNSMDSVVAYATAGTTGLPTSALDVTIAVPANNSFVFDFDDRQIFPNENVVLNFRLPAAGTADVIMGIAWREDF